MTLPHVNHMFFIYIITTSDSHVLLLHVSVQISHVNHIHVFFPWRHGVLLFSINVNFPGFRGSGKRSQDSEEEALAWTESKTSENTRAHPGSQKLQTNGAGEIYEHWQVGKSNSVNVHSLSLRVAKQDSGILLLDVIFKLFFLEVLWGSSLIDPVLLQEET